MKDVIVSTDNRYYKLIKKLNDKKYRDESGVFLAEGEKFLEEKNNFSKVIVKESKYMYYEEKYNISKYENLTILSDKLFDNISTQNNSQGILFIYSKHLSNLSELSGDLIILDAIQDPGNIGTIIRTLVAANYRTLILTKSSVDVYSPKVVRATMGGIFNVNIIYEEKENIIKFLKENGYNIISTALSKESIDYREVELKKDKNAYIFGNEGGGVSDEFLEISHQKAIIPIYGKIESLNVSIALGIFLYKMRELD
ncbi:TrmH family RNA methyltransferase [Streptobacillus moniliformis]|uniref:tRNA/rRNA methyltransferase (SpoU) n=1 Tax=Streptobacillus moniliformis (strain ATCC 14647 / DSM 12112 / NCTC 10651 / 9901) TaxID=519441 RepID=D1AXL4_STRM9|nr:RNA methyltransferase [Streptobacillus moniliformis]ACZ01040.1 tRNA/rRNA methyltransferase (SpoU) [Streptobacillus moniliformis DSM 12112]AVL42592.1 RNA methyltransferase [Streptobacillus moniliformis]QXW65818.1 RNA methyltransferase [Streptobacillus moniliformis]SQA13821.1 rRNA (adenosine-2'-O-)-methyltransferase [Streptobacillus moniliformis]